MSNEQDDIEIKKLKALFRMSDIYPPPEFNIMTLNNEQYEYYKSLNSKDRITKRVEPMNDSSIIVNLKDEFITHSGVKNMMNMFFHNFPNYNFIFVTGRVDFHKLAGVLNKEIFLSNEHKLVFCHEKKHFIRYKEDGVAKASIECEGHFDKKNVYSQISCMKQLFDVLNEHILNYNH